MSKIFISYRRNDVPFLAKQIYTVLMQHFPKDDIFMDVDSIQYGTDFLASIERHIILADVVLVLVGPFYNGQLGERRLMNQDDFVRLELELALRHQKRILPILVGAQTKLPSQTDIPRSLDRLPFLNALRFPAAALSQQDQSQLLHFISTPAQSQAPYTTNSLGIQSAPNPSISLQKSLQVAPPSTSRQKKRGPMNVQAKVGFALIGIAGVLLAAILIFVLGLKGFSNSVPTPMPTATAPATPSPYLPGGKLLLDDSLTAPSQSFNNYVASGYGSCQFIGEKFILSSEITNITFHCQAPPIVTNFAFEITMQIQQGDCGGLWIRGDSSSRKGYFFAVCQDGSYALWLYQNNGKNTLLTGGSSIPGFNIGLNQTNIIAIAANENTFVLYVNGKKIDDRAKDGTFMYGFLGPVADDGSHPTTVAYSNAKVWTVS